MKILLTGLRLQNFKGIRDLKVPFDEHQTNISGKNGSGKTSIFDGFYWLMFDKNSADKQTFNIKTLDENNNAIHKLVHEVSGVITADGVENHLRKEFREKWPKKKGVAVQEFTGHETTYFVNDVPVTQTIYKQKIDEIINENLFKLLTNPAYFNSMKWTDRREVLIKMAGDISDIDIAGDDKDLQALVLLLKNKSIKELRAQLASEKKIIKDELEKIPVRIEEQTNSKPLVEDYAAISKQIEKIELDIESIEKQMDDKQESFKKQNEAITGKHNELNKLKNDLRDSESADKSLKNESLQQIEQKINTAKTNKQTFVRAREQAENSIKSNDTQIKVYEGQVTEKRNEWNTENAKEIVFDENKFICPSCKRPMEADDIETMKSELTTNFNTDKANRLQQINSKGKSIVEDIEKLKSDNVSLAEKVKLNSSKMEELDNELQNLDTEKQKTVAMEDNVSEKTKQLQSQIQAFEIPEVAAINNSELREDRARLVTEMDGLKKKLHSKEQIETADTRIKELSEQEKTMSQQLADLEIREFNIDAFNKKKIETIEQRINSKFQLVKFKMFAQQINGGEDECCDCLVNGVPYSDVNTAGKVNAGLDIINALSDHYGVSAPVFIDNRESTINIIPTNSQIINLIAVKDQPLTIQ